MYLKHWNMYSKEGGINIRSSSFFNKFINASHPQHQIQISFDIQYNDSKC